MNIYGAFDQFQRIVNADTDQVKEARRRRDLFKSAFSGDDDVLTVVPSGSLARGTQKNPIHDVDTIVVFKRTDHPEWGEPGGSAEDALSHTQGRVRDLLGSSGTHAAGEVRLARWRNHAVKSFMDDSEDSEGFTVDVMPALVDGDMYLIPEAVSRKWVHTDPQFLIDQVAVRHAKWDKYAATVRMLKAWADEQDIKIKSLVMEVLALTHLPTDKTRPVAVKEFFAGAAYAIESGYVPSDPADVCGPVQADLDMAEFAKQLRDASSAADRACSAQARGDDVGAIQYWGVVFGDGFPKPPSAGSGIAPVAAVPLPRPVKDTPQG